MSDTYQLTIEDDGTLLLDGERVEGRIEDHLAPMIARREEAALLRRLHVIFCEGCLRDEPGCEYKGSAHELDDGKKNDAKIALHDLKSALDWQLSDEALLDALDVGYSVIN